MCTIAIFSILFLFFQIINLSLNLWDEEFDMWYSYIYFTIIVLQVVGTSFYVQFLVEENERSRSRLVTAARIEIVSILTMGIWDLVYLGCIYQPE